MLAHIQSLPKSSETSDQRYAVSAFPPLLYEFCFVDIEIAFFCIVSKS